MTETSLAGSEPPRPPTPDLGVHIIDALPSELIGPSGRWWESEIDWHLILPRVEGVDGFDILIVLEIDADELHRQAGRELFAAAEVDPSQLRKAVELIGLEPLEWLRSTPLYRSLDPVLVEHDPEPGWWDWVDGLEAP